VFHRSGGPYSHGVRFLGLQRRDGGHEDRVVPNRCGQAGNPLFARSDAGVPEGPKVTPGLLAEPERGPRSARTTMLCRERSREPCRVNAGQECRVAEKGLTQYRERGKSTAPRGPSISQMTSSAL